MLLWTELALLLLCKGLLEIIREKKILTEEQIKTLLDPIELTGLDPAKYPGAKPAVK